MFLFLHADSLCQKNKNYRTPPKAPTKKELAQERENHNCVQKHNSSFADRLMKYPFNKFKKIILVSYLAQPISKEEPGVYAHIGLPKENDTICYSKLHEMVTLNMEQVDSLTNILFNVGFKGRTFLISEMNCYDPRNAILFIDSNNKAFEYIEICFGCDKFEPSSNKIYFGEICEQKFELLRNFFSISGIKYGTSHEGPLD